MKIKIGNFIFINEKKENNIDINNMDFTSDLFNYFYIEELKDTLFVNSKSKFEQAKNLKYKNSKSFDFERSLLKKFSIIIDYKKEIEETVNTFIRHKTLQLNRQSSYISTYKLYKDISLQDIKLLKENSKYNLINTHNTYFDFKEGSVIVDGIRFKPYYNVITNLEELYGEGRFDSVIKASYINLKIKDGLAPRFVIELSKINDFIKDKKSFTLLFNDGEKIKVNKYPFEKTKNNICLNITQRKDIENLKAITYENEILELESDSFQNINKQITKTPNDKISYRIDKLKEEVNTDYNQIMYKYLRNKEKTGKKNISYPYDIQRALNEITTIDIKNNQIKAGKLDEEFNSYPEWYSKDLENLFEKNYLINNLANAKTIKEIKSIAMELKDDVILKNCYKILEDEEESEDNEL